MEKILYIITKNEPSSLFGSVRFIYSLPDNGTVGHWTPIEAPLLFLALGGAELGGSDAVLFAEQHVEQLSAHATLCHDGVDGVAGILAHDAHCLTQSQAVHVLSVRLAGIVAEQSCKLGARYAQLLDELVAVEVGSIQSA